MNDKKILTETETLQTLETSITGIPFLNEWTPSEKQIYAEYCGDIVTMHYDKFSGLNENNKLGIFVINKKHYEDRMEEICKTINYFITYFDKNKQLFNSMLSLKFIIDQRPNMNIKAFIREILASVVTKEYVYNIKSMANYLYTINIDSDEGGRYKNTPKITNDQARLIVAISFAIKCILPLMIHFSETNTNFLKKKDYIKCFDKIIMKIIHLFEKDDLRIFGDLCKFVAYRVNKSYKADVGICIQKKQLYGITEEIYLEEIIHEVILVKSLYKLDYDRSVVSFIDGVIFSYHYNFKRENFKSKPVEIDSQETSENDEHISHAEAIEMAVYTLDESIALINEVNVTQVIGDIKRKFNIPILPEEYQFYLNHVKISTINQFFLESFYSRFFHDPDVSYDIPLEENILLLIYMKKYLQLKGMDIIPQLCTANVRGKFKENVIKNTKFIEKVTTLNAWNTIIQRRFSYLAQVDPKENPLLKRLSSFINSNFEFVDFNDEVNGLVYENIDQDIIIKEFIAFLTII